MRKSGSGVAADQTNAMLAVGGTSYISLISVAAADENSLTPLHRLLPAETASLGFGGSPVGGGDKNSHFTFFRHFYVGGVSLPSGRFVCVGTTPRGVYFGRKTVFSEWVLCADERAVPSCTQCFLGTSVWGRYHYPRRALHAVETLGAQELRRLIYRFYAVPEFALCGLKIPSAGTHATPAPNRAHSGLHAETRRVLRVDGDDVSGSGIIDTIDPFQADQTVAVALAEGHRNVVLP